MCRRAHLHLCGVQALSPGGQWIDVVIPPDCVALLPGYTLQYALAGLLPATQHRVVRAVCQTFRSVEES